MIIFDTNVLSEMMRPVPHAAVVTWIDNLGPDEAWLSSITIFEVQNGLFLMPAGRKRSTLQADFDQHVAITFRNKIATLDVGAAHAAAKINTDRKKRGANFAPIDALIAGIAVARGAAIATRNVKHFADLSIAVINSWTA